MATSKFTSPILEKNLPI